MYLEKLTLRSFKNYSEQDFIFSGKINCFTGNNGAGKTNILDAIYYLSFCKSYFNAADQQNISFGDPFFAIHGTYRRNSNNMDLLSCIQERGKRKKFKCNEKEYNRLADHIGLFPLVMVSPYDRDLINEGSDIRRKFLDSVISQFDRPYLEDLIAYNKVLEHRNALLKKMAIHPQTGTESLEIWDVQLVKIGEKIAEKREQFVHGFIPVFAGYYKMISDNAEEVSVHYVSHLTEGDFTSILERSLSDDMAACFTTKGIHKDDLRLLIAGHPVKKFGSQGQQKSFVLAIRLAQFHYISEIKGFKPVILLDDIFDKLDSNRVQQVVRLLGNQRFGQVFITDTQKERIEKVIEDVHTESRIFEIENGKVGQTSFYNGKNH